MHQDDYIKLIYTEEIEQYQDRKHSVQKGEHNTVIRKGENFVLHFDEGGKIIHFPSPIEEAFCTQLNLFSHLQ